MAHMYEEFDSLHAKIAEKILFRKISVILLLLVPLITWYFYEKDSGWTFETIAILLGYGAIALYGIHTNTVQIEVLKIRLEQVNKELSEKRIKNLG